MIRKAYYRNVSETLYYIRLIIKTYRKRYITLGLLSKRN
jgi:hypothetical protein